jgi:sulfane dehydrogenase subunit SoxC
MEGISLEELQLAARNHGMPLEALRYPVTPVGLHYLLTHYDVPAVEPESWQLVVSGERELTLGLEDLRARPAVELTVTMECAGNGRARLDPRPVSQPWLLEAVGTARWRGTPLWPLLEEAGVREGVVEVLFTGLDRGIEGGEEQSFQRALPLEEALRDEVLLAYEMNGAPLPPQHGFPLRLVVPGWYGMTNVKWLSRIEFLEQPFWGYQNAMGYRLRQAEDDEGEPLSRMQPRSLLVPPGIPEFLTRDRTVDAGAVLLEGRAWSGLAPIASVDVSVDGGSSWAAAELEPAGERWAWRGWSFRWEAEPGDYVLCSRARDEGGNEQPLEPPWNLGGYANNSVQTVRATVTRRRGSRESAVQRHRQRDGDERQRERGGHHHTSEQRTSHDPFLLPRLQPR